MKGSQGCVDLPALTPIDPAMADAFIIRRATTHDLTTVALHRKRMFEYMGHADDPVLAAAEPLYTRWLQERLENGRYLAWFVTAGEDAVVSGAGLWLLDWPAGILGTEPYRGYILNVYTEPQYRKRGLARQLIETILAHCAAEGIRVIGLHASEEGRSVYEALGFKPTNEMRLIIVR